MKTRQERLAEFIDYHKTGDGECNNVVLKAYADKHGLSVQRRYELAVWFAITYCVQSAIFCANRQVTDGTLTNTQLKEIKPKILFQSDRKYMRMRDNFERCAEDYQTNHRDCGRFLAEVTTGGAIDLERAVKVVSQWVMFGRFSAFLFLETLAALLEAKTINTTIDWKKGDTATSGLLNVFALDVEADVFDKSGLLAVDKAAMNKMLDIVKAKARSADASDNVTELETSLCAYRKFYKGSRYNGFYLDRMLAEINELRCYDAELADELTEIRKHCFPAKYLGEIGGWNGIRTELKKHYILTGEIT